jgi:hypothetical protein
MGQLKSRPIRLFLLDIHGAATTVGVEAFPFDA